jgi:hypothetical protein
VERRRNPIGVGKNIAAIPKVAEYSNLGLWASTTTWLICPPEEGYQLALLGSRSESQMAGRPVYGAYVYSADRAPVDVLTCSLSPGAAHLPSFFPISTVLGLESSCKVFCFSPLSRMTDPLSKFTP